MEKTHFRLVETYRKKNPDTPIVLISKPYVTADEDTLACKKVIQETFQKLKQQGDENIYFIDGYDLFDGEQREDCTVDGCPPNDLGFYRMSVVIGDKIKQILDKNK